MSPRARFSRLAPIEKRVLQLGAFSAVALVMIIALVIAVVALSTAKDSKSTANTAKNAAVQAAAAASAAQAFAQADCGTWHDLALIPPSPTATESGLKLWAGFIDSYVNKGCVAISGKLPPPDPRLRQYVKTAH